MEMRRIIPGVLLAAAVMWGHQAVPVDLGLESVVARRGESYLRVTNRTRESRTVTFRPGRASTAEFRPTAAVTVAPGTTVNVGLGDLRLEDGTAVLAVDSVVESTVRGGAAMPGPQLYEVYEVDRTGVTLSSYERAFLGKRQAVEGKSRPVAVDIGGGYMEAEPMARLEWEAREVDPSVPVELMDAPTTYEMARLPLKTLPEAGGGEGPRFAPVRAGRSAGEERAAGVFGSIEGKLFMKLPGPVYQAGWGWKVKVWQCVASSCLQLGTATVGGDGKWLAEYSFPPLPGIQVKVQYQPANRFVKIMDAGGDVYTWGDKWTVTGAAMNIGSRSVDLTKSGDAPGIDVLFQGAMALWRKFESFGMSALRDVPIEITYPNTLATLQCVTQQGAMPVAWSCSSGTNGNIWMIAAHASRGVVQHEVAHAIHRYYWDGDMPAGSGGAHNITECKFQGLALTEGFADFMPYWVQFDRTAVNPTEPSIGVPIENPGPGYCQSSLNEAWVAATFWDAYDTPGDGTAPTVDGWNFTKKHAVISTFLNAVGVDSMPGMQLVYGAVVGPNLFGAVTQSFNLNHMNQ